MEKQWNFVYFRLPVEWIKKGKPRDVYIEFPTSLIYKAGVRANIFSFFFSFPLRYQISRKNLER